MTYKHLWLITAHPHDSYVSFRKLWPFIQHGETPGEGNVSLLSLQRELMAIKFMLFVYNFVGWPYHIFWRWGLERKSTPAQGRWKNQKKQQGCLNVLSYEHDSVSICCIRSHFWWEKQCTQQTWPRWYSKMLMAWKTISLYKSFPLMLSSSVIKSRKDHQIMTLTLVLLHLMQEENGADKILRHAHIHSMEVVAGLCCVSEGDYTFFTLPRKNICSPPLFFFSPRIRMCRIFKMTI